MLLEGMLAVKVCKRLTKELSFAHIYLQPFLREAGKWAVLLQPDPEVSDVLPKALGLRKSHLQPDTDDLQAAAILALLEFRSAASAGAAVAATVHAATLAAEAAAARERGWEGVAMSKARAAAACSALLPSEVLGSQLTDPKPLPPPRTAEDTSWAAADAVPASDSHAPVPSANAVDDVTPPGLTVRIYAECFSPSEAAAVTTYASAGG